MISGFSKLTKEEKRKLLADKYLGGKKEVFEQYDLKDESLDQLHSEFSENTIGNYVLPFGIAPNFLINGHYYNVPMVIEESSVVAGVSKAAKFWAERGGFRASVIGTEKIGQVHFFYEGEKGELERFFEKVLPVIMEDTSGITRNMRARNGGITSVVLVDKTSEIENYYQVHVTFETLDAMGANFINTCLEQIAKTLEREAVVQNLGGKLDVLMSILSNYVPNCVVKVEASCAVEDMVFNGVKGEEFSMNFVKAIQVANCEVYRAVTHNKGVMNGIDAVVIATGNDFRAVEACVQAYSARSGRYKSMTEAYVKDGVFCYSIELPLALGTVGGLTKLHPMVKTALELLENPDARTLMGIVASVGLAQNFAAVGSLVTSGIQKGHMKMHLGNILNQLGATGEEKIEAIKYFEGKTITYNDVAEFLKK